MEANISEYTEDLWRAVYPKAAVSHTLPSVMTLPKYPLSNISLLLPLFYILNSFLVEASSLVFCAHSSSHVDFKPERFAPPSLSFTYLYSYLSFPSLRLSAGPLCWQLVVILLPALPFLHLHFITWQS